MERFPTWARAYLRDRGDGVPAVVVGDDGAMLPDGSEPMTLTDYYARYMGVAHRAVRVWGLSVWD
jgi:hypothetical protein